jgi:hypothetical protein
MGDKASDIAREGFTCALRSVADYPMAEVFADFVQLTAYEFANASISCTAREARMREIRARYSESEQRAFRAMREAFDAGVSLKTDFLGELFKELDLRPHSRCRFPSSWPLAMDFAQLTLSAWNVDEKIRTDGCSRITGDDVGSGGIILAIAQLMLERGHDPQRYLHATGREAEPILAYMSYLQLAALEIPAVVSIMPRGAKAPVERLYTPAHYERLPDILRGLRDRELAEQRSAPSEV